jgi:putative membrane protein
VRLAHIPDVSASSVRLSAEESKAIAALVARVEARTGIQVVVAVIEKSDSYVELPWKAFALGASMAAFATVMSEVWRPQWVTSETAMVHAVIILGVAAACALLAVFVPGFGRLFLREERSHLEVQHYAQSFFLTHQLFRTESRNALLVLVSEFERRIEILPDVGLHTRVNEAEWRRVIDAMAAHLREARRANALQEGLRTVEQLLVSTGLQGRAGAPNELPDRPVEEHGV